MPVDDAISLRTSSSFQWHVLWPFWPNDWPLVFYRTTSNQVLKEIGTVPLNKQPTDIAARTTTYPNMKIPTFRAVGLPLKKSA